MPSTVSCASWPGCPRDERYGVPVVASLSELLSMVIWPAAPPVWLMSESREPLLSVTTLAEMPMPAWLMVAARPAMVLFAGSTETVCELPLPMWKVKDPLSVSVAATALEASVEV